MIDKAFVHDAHIDNGSDVGTWDHVPGARHSADLDPPIWNRVGSRPLLPFFPGGPSSAYRADDEPSALAPSVAGSSADHLWRSTRWWPPLPIRPRPLVGCRTPLGKALRKYAYGCTRSGNLIKLRTLCCCASGTGGSAANSGGSTTMHSDLREMRLVERPSRGPRGRPTRKLKRGNDASTPCRRRRS